MVIATADDQMQSQGPVVEPEIIRLTRLNSATENPTQPRPAPSADITRMGAPPMEDVDDDDDDDDDFERVGLLTELRDFVELNMLVIIAGIAAVALIGLGLMYLS